ncbi:leucine-rich repeat-containing protein 63 isoform X2 [Onychostoma macrolepis]|uniref:leucine-rich repeat-containing protein 63 isoform X2 n=1 Tax=Onychostoma macrolepis TaxID=369639 RepID=UPI00272BABE7|nr:leucine-rich repeat-containing protein 63 isoform X2 [Onychostoma macrolepis]XP_058642401.1 leucine-rich repeat-containing protein 63 isoform X2 [Onychostoma macrolepis]
MSSEHMKLLRRPLAPVNTAHYRTPPAPRSAGSHMVSVFPDRDEASESVCRPQTLREDDDGVAPIISGSSHHPQRSAPVHLQPRPPDLFCLNDFLQVSGSADDLRRTVLSRWNYRKLLRLFLSELHCGGQDAVANQTLSCEGLSPPTRRIPRRQIICELAAMVQIEARAQNSFRSHSGVCRASEDQSVERRTEHTRHELYTVLLNAVTSKHFQDSRRSRSPFRRTAARDFISASELAVLDCVTRGGATLSFKAHFIGDLPDVTSLSERLQYLNLSFNHLTHVPQEVCDLHQLQVLKMRNNPIEELPAQISKLHKLQTLVASFCKITQLPDQLYSLACLQHLDVSYNLLRSLSSEVRHLRSLRSLNVEGNQLVALPAGLLRVSVSELRMSGNYTHVLLWSENSCNCPQTLLHTAAHTLTHTHAQQHYTHLPPAARMLLNSAGVCDACTGLMFGAGLKLIRPVPGVFGLPFVPVMFCCCSPACLHRFRNQTIITV